MDWAFIYCDAVRHSLPSCNKMSTMAVRFGLLLVLVTSLGPISIVDTSGTTPNIEEIFMGRCIDFQETLDTSVKE